MNEDKIIAQPMSQEEIQALMDRANNALGAMQVWHDCLVHDNGGKETSLSEMIASAISIFGELIAQWSLAVGKPQKISKETLMKIADRTAEIMKSVLREQIRAGKL